MRATGRDARLLVAGYDIGSQRLVGSSLELIAHAAIPAPPQRVE